MKKSENLCQTDNTPCRRNFLQTIIGTGLGAGGFFAADAFGANSTAGDIEIPLKENDIIDIGDKGDEYIQKAYENGVSFTKKHTGCSRCFAGAMIETLDFIPWDESLVRNLACLTGVATPTKMANCGAFSGPGVILGWLCGEDNFGDSSVALGLMREVYTKFEEEYGSVLCKDLRGAARGNCPEIVGNSMQWTTEIILKKFTNYA